LVLKEEVIFTCNAIIPIEDVVIFKENIGAFDVKPIGIERENVWDLRAH
jgi:hypothetical protein